MKLADDLKALDTELITGVGLARGKNSRRK